jgi:hypothetical protein
VSSNLQTIAALVLVAIAATWLIVRAVAKRKNPGCGGDCGAVSPEIKKLQAKLRRQSRGGRI